MTTIINAVSGSGLTQTADGSGVIKVQSNGTTTNALAWVNFGYVSSVTVNSSYNVSSVTRTNTARYTISFSNALTDANYAVVPIGTLDTASSTSTYSFLYGIQAASGVPTLKTTSQVAVMSQNAATSFADCQNFSVLIFGN